MKLATVRVGDDLHAARLEGDHLTVLPERRIETILAAGDGWRSIASAPGSEEIALEDADLAPVVPNPGKVICVGLNYRDHAGEAKRELPAFPQLFAKYTEALIGAHDQVMIPAVSDQVDWEAEITIVIGSEARYVSEAKAADHIAGYTVANDISIRDWQRRTPQFLQGKTFEHTTPVGPYLVTSDDVDVRDLRVTCKVNGEVVQDFSTAQMVFKPDYLVSYISHIITLKPGDLILTGTGSGVGVANDPPRFLQPQDTVVTEIDGLGRLENVCVPDGADGSRVPAPRSDDERVPVAGT